MVIKTPSYSPGSLVQARDRNWVVLPADEEDVVVLRPVDGSDEDSIGIFLPIERDSISPSEYDWPDPGQAGNFQGGLLLRDAVRLTLRSGAVPYQGEVNFVEVPGFNPNIRLVEEEDGAHLHITWPPANADRQNQIVTTGLLGKARIPNLSYVNPDGTLLKIDSDYFGKRRNKQNPSAGPFEDPGKGKLSLKVWQGKR